MKLSEVIHFYYGQPCHSCIYVTGQKKSWDQGSIDTRALFNIKAGLGESIPLLRPLSSMTEEEAMKLFNITDPYPKDTECKISRKSMGYTEQNHTIHESVLCFRFDVFVRHPSVNKHLPALLLQLDDEDCSVIWGQFTDAGQELQDSVSFNQSEQFAYLTSKGFDVFGLLRSQQAIDITKLNKDAK